MKSEFITKFKVMGTFAENREKNVKYVLHGSKFRFKREPENEYDENAIMIQLPVKKGTVFLDLGYVPRELAAEIAPQIDSGTDFKATFRTKILNEKNGKLIGLYLNLFRQN